MAPRNENDQDDVDTTELDGIDDSEAEQLLDKPAEKSSDDATDGDADQLGDRGKRALDRMKAAEKAAKKEAAELKTRLAKYEDANKTEMQRLTEERDQFRESSTKAVSKAKALEIALECAPEHASLAHVRAVAKRVRGENDDELEADAAELFELLAPEPKAASKTPSRPKERLRGGSEPDEEPEETDPKKLAALIPRRR